MWSWIKAYNDSNNVTTHYLIYYTRYEYIMSKYFNYCIAKNKGDYRKAMNEFIDYNKECNNMALTVDRLEEFIVTLGSLVSGGILDDVMAFGSNCRSISITKTTSIQEFYTCMKQIDCSSIGLKLSRKLRYERPIVLTHIVDFKLNNMSLVVTTYNGNYTDTKKYRF